MKKKNKAGSPLTTGSAGEVARESGVRRKYKPRRKPAKLTAEQLDLLNQSAPKAPPDAVVFNVNVDVALAEMATWSPGRITRFFSGLASICEAVKGVAK